MIQTITQAFSTVWQTLSGWLPAIKNFLTQNWRSTAITAIALIMATSAYVSHKKDYGLLLIQAQNYLNIGYYTEARIVFEQAIATHPIFNMDPFAFIINNKTGQMAQQIPVFLNFLTEEAELGLEKAKLAESVGTAKREIIEYQLKQLATENPNDADIQTLLGKYSLSLLEKETAESYYKKAIKLNGNIAEAHFGLCAIYELDGKITEAVTECENALKHSEIQPTNYVINLAGLYLQQEKYKQALHLIAKRDSKYLNVKFELARIYLFTNELTRAIDFETQVLAGLNDSKTMEVPENQTIWYYKSDFENVLLKTVNDKKCYVTYTLALTSYLKNDLQAAENHIKASAEPCKQHDENIKNIVRYDLEIAAKNSQLSKQVKEFEKIFDKTNAVKYTKNIKRMNHPHAGSGNTQTTAQRFWPDYH